MTHSMKMTYAVAIKNSPLGRQRFLSVGRCDIPRRLMNKNDTFASFELAQAEADHYNRHLTTDGQVYAAVAFKAV